MKLISSTETCAFFYAYGAVAALLASASLVTVARADNEADV